jgi:hypothetical protein
MFRFGRYVSTWRNKGNPYRRKQYRPWNAFRKRSTERSREPGVKKLRTRASAAAIPKTQKIQVPVETGIAIKMKNSATMAERITLIIICIVITTSFLFVGNLLSSVPFPY